MLRTQVKIQIALFFVIAVVGVGYAGWSYAGLDRLTGHDGYRVTLELPRGGGLFTGGDVSYRGVTVGRVGEVRLATRGVEAVLDIEPDAPAIPASAQAVVTLRSAIGEQYVDLRPDTDAGPYLADGARIPASRTRLPLPPDRLLTNADRLLSGLPTDALRTVVDELHLAFAGSAPHLERILDDTSALLATARAHLPQTTNLIRDSATVLGTQRDIGADLTSFARDLRSLSGTLKAADPDLRTLLDAAPPAAREVDALVAEAGPDLSALVAHLATTTDILKTRTAGLEHSLSVLPYLGPIGHALLPGDGTAHLGFVFNIAEPLPCTRGYEGTRARSGDDLRSSEPNRRAYCAEPKGSPISVRGSQNAPFGGFPAQPRTPGTAQQTSSAGAAEAGDMRVVSSLRGLMGLPDRPPAGG